MTTVADRHRFLSPPEYAYLATLVMFFVASFFPEQRVWGVNWWAYWPVGVRVGVLTLGMLVIPIVRRVAVMPALNTDDMTKRTYIVVAVALVVGWGLLFYLLRARTHFLGDGYTLLSLMATSDPLVKGRNLGGMLPQLWLSRALGEPSKENVLLAYQTLSIAAGIVFLTTIIAVANRVIARRMDRLLFLVFLATGGFMLQFFGYVENYALFLVSVLTFVVVGMLVAEQKLNRWWIVPCVIMASVFHVFGVVLIIGAMYLLTVNTAPANWLQKLSTMMKTSVILPCIGVAGVAFGYFYTTDYYFRFAFVPIIADQFTVDGYTMFSAKHLLDFLNLLLVLLPGIIVAVPLMSRTQGRAISKQRVATFLSIVTICSLGAAFVFDPKLGMPRDWDLFAFWAIPFSLLVWRLIAHSEINRRVAVVSILLMISLSTLSLFSRALAQHQPTLAVEHFQNYLLLAGC
ncbi:MAG: hypothetical protein AB1644_04185 [Candidatus Zixiibacteriota bacterium]